MMKNALPLLIEAYSDLADRARRAAAEDRATKELESSLYIRFRYAFLQCLLASLQRQISERSWTRGCDVQV